MQLSGRTSRAPFALGGRRASQTQTRPRAAAGGEPTRRLVLSFMAAGPAAAGASGLGLVGAAHARPGMGVGAVELEEGRAGTRVKYAPEGPWLWTAGRM
jgi:hypothetical protein